MFRNIIVPVDPDRVEKSKALLEKAKDLSDEAGKVTVVSVIENVPGLLTAELPEGLTKKAAQTAHDSLAAAVKATGLNADVQIRSGRPHNAIVDMADEIGADLVLMASHDPDLRDYFLASTAASVVQHAKCSVLVAR